MNAKTWTFIDKSTWGEGPWTIEPDKIVWTDESTGLPCMVRRNERVGHLCGYVAIAEGHPLFERDFGQMDPDLDVHGRIEHHSRDESYRDVHYVRAQCQQLAAQLHAMTKAKDNGHSPDA